MLKGVRENCKELSVNVWLLIIFLPNSLTLLAAFAVLSGLILFVRGFRVLARKRLVLDTPTCKIRSTPLGLVEVSGLAGGPHTLSAPVTNVPCYLYHTIVWRKKETGKNHDWEKVIDENVSIPFFLDDNTGQVLVDPTGAELDLHRDFREEYNSSFFSSFGDVPPSVRDFVARHGISTTSALRVEERCIKPKNALFVVGTIMENPSRAWPRGPAEQVTAQSPKTLLARIELPSPHEVVRLSTASTLQSSGEMTLQGKIAAALNRAQITKPEAWAAAGMPGGPNAAATTEIKETPKNSSPSIIDLAPSTMLQKGENNPTFMISWRSRQAVVRKLGWKSFGMVWGGSALILLGIYTVLQQAELL
jgi:hypothetical protein